MGASYTSIQVPGAGREEVRAVLERIINEPGISGIELYFGDAIDGWTAIYPMVSEQMDKLATRVSKEFGRLVLTLGSYDEDDFFLNANVSGKESGIFQDRDGEKTQPKGARSGGEASESLSGLLFSGRP